MSDNKSKKASKEAINTNGDSPKPDDDSEHTTMSKTNGNGNSNNGNNLLPHGKKNGSSGELSNSSKKNAKTEENSSSTTTTTNTITNTSAKKAFTDLAKKNMDKKRPNESSASSISKSDVSKKSDESANLKSKVVKRPKYHVKKNDKLKLQEDFKSGSAGIKDKEDSGRSVPVEGTSKSHVSPGFNERSPINGGKETPSELGTPANENKEDGNATPIDQNNDTKGELADGLSIQGTETSNTSSSFQPAPTLVENPKPVKKTWSSFWKSWSTCLTSKLGGDVPSQLGDTDQNSSENSVSKSLDIPDIPTQYRPKEINGFGMFSKSQSLPIETKKNYQKLLSTSLELILEFCRYLEILNERSGKQDIQDAFLIQFGRFHSGLPFTETEGNEALNEEELVQLSNLFNDIYHNNNTIWIANKFEYTSFSRKFRKAIAETLESDYQIKISRKKTLFPRQVICASLIQWRRNIPFS